MAAVPENLCAGGHPQARSACSPTGDPLPSPSPLRGGTPGPGHRARGRLVWDQSPSSALGPHLPAAAPAGTTDGGGLCSRSFQDVLLPLPLLGLRWAADYLPSQKRPVNVGEQPRCTRHHPRPRKPEVRRGHRVREQVSGDGPLVSVTAVWGGLAGYPGDQGSGEAASPHVHVSLGHPSLSALTRLHHVRGSE